MCKLSLPRFWTRVAVDAGGLLTRWVLDVGVCEDSPTHPSSKSVHRAELGYGRAVFWTRWGFVRAGDWTHGVWLGPRPTQGRVQGAEKNHGNDPPLGEGKREIVLKCGNKIIT